MDLADVGFIGLGNMGGPMAANIARAGFPTVVTDLDSGRVATAVNAGCRPAASAVDAAARAAIVLTSLPGPKQVEEVAKEIVPLMRPGSVWIDLSTNDLTCAQTIADLAGRAEIHVVDAPVTGGVEGAVAGNLTVLVGGEPDVVRRCRPVLDAIGDRIEHLGPHGAGYVAKITQVSLCYLHSVCLTEALLLGAKGGVDPARMLDVIRHSTGRSYVADRYGPEILNGGYDDTFDLGLAHKDLRLAMEMAETVGATLPFMNQVTAFYREAEEQFGAAAPHLLAMQKLELSNQLILHESDMQTTQDSETQEHH